MFTKIFSYSTIIISVTLSLLSASAQQKPYEEVTIASPNAASLGKYTDIPISYHTGLPQISIPFYTVKEGSLSLPISLSYHSGGIKVMEPASWVGTGWSLEAGGAVMRSVRGAPDEQGTSKTMQGHFSDYGYSSYPMNASGGPPLSTNPNVPYDAGFANGIYDGEPDLYTFNFNGYSGKFYFRDDRTPVLIPQQDLKIEPYFPGGGTQLDFNIRGFVITIPNGTKYYFGSNADGTSLGANPVETTFPYSHGNTNVGDKVISSWFLHKIVSGDNQFTIQLSYETEEYGYHTFSMFPIWYIPSKSFDPTANPYEYDGVKNYVSGVRLRKITFSSGEVNFLPGDLRTDLCGINSSWADNTNSEAKTLSSIQISDLQSGGLCKSFDLSYSYFVDNLNTTLPGQLSVFFGTDNIQTDKKRLKLNAIQEHSCNNTVELPPYTFTYSSDFLPRRLSFAQDHWGFYNGANGNNTLIPTYTVDNTKVDGADRDCHDTQMSNGILTKITYPTGGYTLYNFEPNAVPISFQQTVPVPVSNISTPYTGSANPGTVINYSSLNAGDYIFTLNNSPGGSDAGFFLINSSNQTVFSMSATPGQSTTYIKNNLPSDYYQLKITKDRSNNGNLVSGVGANAVAAQFVTNTVTQSKSAGGLRISSIVQNDGISASNNITTNYSYGGAASAVLYSRPRYLQILRNDDLAFAGFPGNQTTTNLEPHGCVSVELPGLSFPYFKSPCGISPLSTVQGYHIGYKEVQVSQTGNGHTIYRYYGPAAWNNSIEDIAIRTLNTNSCNFSIPNWPSAPLPFDYNRGELQYEGHYDESGQLLQESTYLHEYDSSSFTTPGYIVRYFPGAGSDYGMLGTQYELKEYWKKQTQVITSSRMPNGNYLTGTTTTNFASPYHYQPTSVVTSNSRGQTVEEKLVYPADYRVPSCDAISSCLADYNSACASCNAAMNSAIASSTNYAGIYIAHTDNKICRMNARKALALCRKDNFIKLNNTFQVCMDNALGAADEYLKPILQMRKSGVVVPVEQSTWKDSKLTAASFTRFNYASNTTGFVYPFQVQTINVSAPATSFTTSSVSSSMLIKDSHYTPETDLDWAQGNLVGITKREGITTAYLYGYNNTKPVAKVVSAAVSNGQLKMLVDMSIIQNPSSDAALRTELNKIRTAVPAAMVTTYTYSPLNGITSETAPDGRTTYYEYDVLGRLKDVKDHNGNVIKTYNYQYQQTP